MIKPILRYICILILVVLTTCCVRQYYVEVPYSHNTIYNTYGVEWFSCVSCQSDYDQEISNYINDNKIVWVPFADEHYRSSDFLITIHNSLKAVGYKKLISEGFYQENLNIFIDSLLYYSERETNILSYYSMFLHRRELDGTKKVTLQIVSDIDSIFKGYTLDFDENFINDTLISLANLDYRLKSDDGESQRKILMEIYDFLVLKEQYHLAYQLMRRPVDFADFGFSKDSALLTFPLDTVKETSFTDTTIRLGNFDKDGNWTDSYLYWKDYPGP